MSASSAATSATRNVTGTTNTDAYVYVLGTLTAEEQCDGFLTVSGQFPPLERFWLVILHFLREAPFKSVGVELARSFRSFIEG